VGTYQGSGRLQFGLTQPTVPWIKRFVTANKIQVSRNIQSSRIHKIDPYEILNLSKIKEKI
jgi:hypothetical protein